MKTEEIQSRLFEIVKIYLPQDVDANAIKADSHLMNDLNINSAHLVDIALDVEDAFDITLNEKDMEAMQNRRGCGQNRSIKNGLRFSSIKVCLHYLNKCYELIQESKLFSGFFVNTDICHFIRTNLT